MTPTCELSVALAFYQYFTMADTNLSAVLFKTGDLRLVSSADMVVKLSFVADMQVFLCYCLSHATGAVMIMCFM